MARYENEPRPYAPQREPQRVPQPEDPPKDKDRDGGGSAGGRGRQGGGGGTLVGRREWFHRREYGPAEPAPVRYHHEDLGHDKPSKPGRKKLGSGHGIGAVPHSPLPDGVESVTVFLPGLLTGRHPSDVKTLVALSRLKDGLAESGAAWWEDRKTGAVSALDISREAAEQACKAAGVDSFHRIAFGPDRDAFRSSRHTAARDGSFRESSIHMVTCVSPPEVLETAGKCTGFKIPEIPPDILKDTAGMPVYID